MNQTEIQSHASFDTVRYANCWEDADILVEALIPKDKVCASIGSAGDNSFALLAAGAKEVHVVEMNPAQIACIYLRKAAYQCLSHQEFLQLHGEAKAAAEERQALYQQCVPELPEEVQDYWRSNQEHLESGYGLAGKFENYFTLFREKILPWIHTEQRIQAWFSLTGQEERENYYVREWNNFRWRMLFKIFFSRYMMGRLARDPAFFKYVEGSVSDRILGRAKYALTKLNPATNPYLTWILTGRYGTALPYALREEYYGKIRDNIQSLKVHEGSLEAFLADHKTPIDAFNLSDIFEYMSEANTKAICQKIEAKSAPGARLAYWNMLAPRAAHKTLPQDFKKLDSISEDLFLQDKAFFYSAFYVDERINKGPRH